MQAGVRELFVSVFVPYLRSQTSVSAFQATVGITQEPSRGNATVTVGTLSVELDVDGKWSVAGR